MKKKVLLTGGAGYIGSHTALDLIQKGYEVVSIDNFSNASDANFSAIEKLTGQKVKNYNIDLCDLKACKEFFEEEKNIDTVIHLAAFKYVGESEQEPFKYIKNNCVSLINILDCLIKYEVKKFVFSSSCTVYGSPEKLPVTETSPLQEAESPYGRTKQMGEYMIMDMYKSDCPFNTVILRYFNPAGIHESGLIKETTSKRQETLVPIIQEVYQNKRAELVVFGSDYETRDGTCIRDYIHIMDLAEAHTKSVDFLQSKLDSTFEIFNLGTGEGLSIKEMITSAEEVFETPLNYRLGHRREGDIAATYSDNTKAKEILGWSPKRNIKDIFKSIKNNG